MSLARLVACRARPLRPAASGFAEPRGGKPAFQRSVAVAWHALEAVGAKRP